MSEFKDMMEDMPYWQDLGRKVEAVKADGTTVVGTVEAWDVTFDGEDEHPLLSIDDADNKEHRWFDFERWRYVEIK